MAFTVTNDHVRQQEVWDQVSHTRGLTDEPYNIRRKLTEGAVRATDRRAVFVGVGAYEVAGGAVFPYGHTQGLRHLHGRIVELTEEETAARKALEVELDDLEQQYAEADDVPEAADRRFEEIEAALAAFRDRPVIYDPGEIAFAGAPSRAPTDVTSTGAPIANSCNGSTVSARDPPSGAASAPFERNDGAFTGPTWHLVMRLTHPPKQGSIRVVRFDVEPVDHGHRACLSALHRPLLGQKEWQGR
jgi:hypothetical protein